MQVPEHLLTDEILDGLDDEVQVRFPPPLGVREWPSVQEWGAGEWSHWLGLHAWSPERISSYLLKERYQYGLGFRRHKGEGYRWFYHPVPAAVAMHKSKTLNLLYGGAAGGTKSHSTRWESYAHCWSIKDYRSIIMRRTFEELKRNHLDRARAECERINQYFQDEVMVLVMGDHEIRFPKTGSKIVFGHCQNPGDEEKYLGDEYDDFRPDEMATFEKSQIVGVAGRLRSVKQVASGRVRSRLVGTSNPGGAHTLYLKQWFIDKNVPKQENPRFKPENFEFIQAVLYDNPWLMDPDGTYTSYEDRLYAYSPQRRRQLLNGDWTAIAGQFFPEFTAAHVRELEIPRGCKIERCIDWGYSPNPGVCHWVACFPNGRLYVFAEWVFNGEGRRLLVASQVADKITQITKEVILPQSRGRLSKSIGDPSMWAKDGHSGESFEETFRKHGVRMIQADNDRVLGWGRLRHWLRGHPEGGTWLMFHPDCRYAIRTIPALIHDKNDPDDLDTHGEDHAADAIRYLCMARPQPTTFARLPLPSLSPDMQMLLASTRVDINKVRPFGQVS